MHSTTLLTLVVVTSIAVAAPLISDRMARWLLLPGVAIELVLGIVVGPQVLGWAREDEIIASLADLGLALLMFLAGYEIEFDRIRGRPVRLAVAGWLASLVLGLGFGALVHGMEFGALVLGLALTTTALGTLLPVVRDAGLLPTRFGSRFLAVGAIGEFGPIVAIALLLGGDEPAHVIVFLLLFLLIAVIAAILATRPRPDWLSRLLRVTLGTSAQLAVRVSLLALIALVWAATGFGLDYLLGAFAAGIVMRLRVSTVDPAEVRVVESKMEAIGFGFFIPIYFVVSGMRFDLKSLLADPKLLLLVPVFLVILLAVRGGPVLALYRQDLPPGDRRGLALFAAAALPLVVAITGTGVSEGYLRPAIAATLVGAAVLSVIAFPILGMRLRRADGGEPSARRAVPSVAQD